MLTFWCNREFKPRMSPVDPGGSKNRLNEVSLDSFSKNLLINELKIFI